MKTVIAGAFSASAKRRAQAIIAAVESAYQSELDIPAAPKALGPG